MNIQKNIKINRNIFLQRIDEFSDELSNIHEEQFSRFILNKSISLFNLSGSILYRLNEDNSEIIIKDLRFPNRNNSKLMKLLLSRIKQFPKPIDKINFDNLIDDKVIINSKINDNFYKLFPKFVGKFLEKYFKIGWYARISLLNQDKLAGWLILLGNKNQEIPCYEYFTEFSNIISTSEVNNKMDNKMLFNNKFLSKIYETAGEGFWLLDANFKTILVNKKLTEMIGYEENEIIGKEVDDFMFPEDIKDRLIKKRERLEGKSSIHERRFKKKNNNEVFTLVSSTPIYDDNGEFIGSFGMLTDITEKKQIEQELRESKSKYETITKSTLDIIFVLDKKGTQIYFNDRVTDILGYNKEDVIGKSFINFVPKSEYASYISQLKNVFKHRTVSHFITKIYHKDGSLIDVEINGKLTNWNGELAAQGTIREISERKKAEDALKSLKEAYFDIFNSVTEAIYILDENGVFIDINKGAEKMYQYTREELLGKSPIVVSAEGYNDLDSVYKKMQNVLETGISDNFEFWATRKNGEIFPKEVYINRGKYFDKNVLIATARDISSQKSYEDKILKNERKFKLLNKYQTEMLKIDTLEELYYYIVSKLNDVSKGSYILFNTINLKEQKAKLVCTNAQEKKYYDKAVDTIGFNPVGVEFDLNHKIFELSNEGVLVEFSGGLVDFASPVLPKIVSEFLVKLTNINKIYTIGMKRDDYLLAAIHFFTTDDNIISDYDFINSFIQQAGIIIQKKIIELELGKKEVTLNELIATKDKFFSIIAHDLRGPISSVKTLIEFIANHFDEYEKDEILDNIRLVKESTKSTYDLLEDLLSWSRSQSDKIVLFLDECELDLLIDNVIQTLELTAKKKEIKIIYSRKKSYKIFGDINLINLTVRNILSNAIKFSYNNSVIEIGLLENFGNYDCIFIKDYGLGMKQDAISKLFKIDTQQSSVGTNNEKGTGLGLILCKEFIEKMGGKIWVDSKFGVGSTFYFTLPKKC